MKRVLSIIMCLLMVFSFMPVYADTETNEETVSSIGLFVDYHTQDEIKEFASKLLSKRNETIFDATPKYEGNYALGKISENSLNEALNVLNAARYVAGIPYNVELKEEYNELAQAAALGNAAICEMTHYPEKAENMNQTLYEKCALGARSSNLNCGGISIGDCVIGWLSDANNVAGFNQGHRRWCLNPTMKYTGFGNADNYNAMYAFDESNISGKAYSGVAWPAQNMPLQLFSNSDAWTISFGRVLNKSSIKVTLKRKSDSKEWEFSENKNGSMFDVCNVMYGQKGCVIFQPENIKDYKDGDTFHVTVTERDTVIADYDVNFFDLYPIKSAKAEKSTYKFRKSQYNGYYLFIKVSPKYTMGSVKVSSSNKKIITVSGSGKVNNGYIGRSIKFKKTGTAYVIVKDNNGKVLSKTKFIITN